MNAPNVRVISYLLGMRIAAETQPCGEDINTYVENLGRASSRVLQIAAKLCQSVPFRMIPFSDPQLLCPVILAMKTQWTLDQTHTLVEVRDSPVHGQGVFALEDLEVGTLCTVYPVHAIVTMFAGEERILTPDNTPSDDNSRFGPYKVDLFQRKDICISADPNVYDSFRCGHKINDARGTQYKNNVEFADIFGGIVVAMVVTTDIPKGSELFLDYGETYWA